MSTELKIVVLVVLAAALALATRRSLKSLSSHGVYRLLGWVAAVALVLVNLEKWFTDPFAAHQIVSWCLLLLSAITPVYGFVSLRKGRPGASRGDPTLMSVERTTELVDAGAYRYVRHPMYSSFLFAAFGTFLKDVSWLSALLTAIVTLSAFLAAKTEERENIAYFGDAYRSYMARTKRFIPWLF